MPWINPELTGEIRYRQSFFGKLIVQVEVEKTLECNPDSNDFSFPPWHGSKRKTWRDAKIKDILVQWPKVKS